MLAITLENAHEIHIYALYSYTYIDGYLCAAPSNALTQPAGNPVSGVVRVEHKAKYRFHDIVVEKQFVHIYLLLTIYI